MPSKHPSLWLSALIFITSKLQRTACILPSRDIAFATKDNQPGVSEESRTRFGAVLNRQQEVFPVNLDLELGLSRPTSSSWKGEPKKPEHKNNCFELESKSFLPQVSSQQKPGACIYHMETSSPAPIEREEADHLDSRNVDRCLLTLLTGPRDAYRRQRVGTENENRSGVSSSATDFLNFEYKPAESKQVSSAVQWRGPLQIEGNIDRLELERSERLSQHHHSKNDNFLIPENPVLSNPLDADEDGKNAYQRKFLKEAGQKNQYVFSKNPQRGLMRMNNLMMAVEERDCPEKRCMNNAAFAASQNFGIESELTKTAGMMGSSNGKIQADPSKTTATLKVGQDKADEDIESSISMNERKVWISPESISSSLKRKSNYDWWKTKSPYPEKLTQVWDSNMKEGNMNRCRPVSPKPRRLQDYSKILKEYPSFLYEPDTSPQSTRKAGVGELNDKRRAAVMPRKARSLLTEEDLLQDILVFFCKLKENMYECIHKEIQASELDEYTKQITYGYSINKIPSKGLKDLFPIERFTIRATQLAITTLSKVESIGVIIGQASGIRVLRYEVWHFFKKTLKEFIPFLPNTRKFMTGNTVSYSLDRYLTNWKEVAFESLTSLNYSQKETSIMAISNYILIDWIHTKCQDFYIAIAANRDNFQSFRRITSDYLVDKNAVMRQITGGNLPE